MIFILKALVSGLLIAGASTLARKHPGPAGIVVALPVTTLLTLIWMGLAGATTAELGTFLQSVGWVTLAGLGLFFLTPWLIRTGWGFWPAFAMGILVLGAGTWVVKWYSLLDSN